MAPVWEPSILYALVAVNRFLIASVCGRGEERHRRHSPACSRPECSLELLQSLAAGSPVLGGAGFSSCQDLELDKLRRRLLQRTWQTVPCSSPDTVQMKQGRRGRCTRRC